MNGHDGHGPTEKLISPLIELYGGDAMNISIEMTGYLLDYLDNTVRSGRFKSRSEAVRSALRDMIQRDIEEQLRAKGIGPKDLKRLRGVVARDVLKKKKYRKLA